MTPQDEAAMLCTAPYRAPELHDPHRGTILDGRVDVFSLGCLLFMMAFGSNPFEPNGEFAKLALLNGKYKIPAGGRSCVLDRVLLFYLLRLHPCIHASICISIHECIYPFLSSVSVIVADTNARLTTGTQCLRHNLFRLVHQGASTHTAG